METATPAYELSRSSMMSILSEHMNGYLAAFGHSELPESAFAPIVQIDPVRDTICAAYSGARRDNETYRSRDNDVIININIWGFGANDVAAQQRAIALEAAAVAALDDEDHRYLDGACDAPISIGRTVSATQSGEDAANLCWQLGFPVLCPIRTSRPEVAPVEDDPEPDPES